MKTKSILSTALAVIAMVSCQDNVVPEMPMETPESYTVRLDCAGELDVNHVPLKSSTDDLYGIQVYYAPVSGGSYQKYAYGLFDDISDVSLELIADYKYKFVVDLIVNGKNTVYSSNMNELEEEEVLIGYGNPFKTDIYSGSSSNYNLTAITNELIISKQGDDSYTYFSGLGGGIQLTDGNTYYHPKGIDAYYGRLEDYIPQEEGATISIYMKHMIFGLKVIADNFLTQGEVEGVFAQYSSSAWYQDAFTLTPTAKEYEATYAYTSRGNWYDLDVQDDANETMSIDFSWVKDENTTLTLDRQTIKMIRMKKTIVNVTFFEDESAGNTKASFVYDDLEMTDNETSYTFGDDQDEYEW